MGTIYKKTYTKRMPQNATITTRKGVRIAKWKDRAGKTKTAEVTESDRIRIEAGTYTAKYRDGSGIVREVATGCRDKQAAQSVLRELERRAELVKADVMTIDQDAIAEHQKTPLADHIKDYIQHIRRRGVHPDRVKTTETRLVESATNCGFKRLADLNHDKLVRWMNASIADAERSASVYNGYVAVWKAFGFWLAGKRKVGRKFHWNGDKRILKNPFSGLGQIDEADDRRRVARSLTADELSRLLDAAASRPLRDAMTIRRGKNRGKLLSRVSEKRRTELVTLGHERVLIYKTLFFTGLRANELRTLTIGDLSFGDVPFVRLRKSNEKARKGSTIPLRMDLASELRQWVEGRDKTDKVFDIADGFLRIMNRDLKAAGIPKKDADGRVVHVHGLRTTFGTHLSTAGVSPRVAQAAMRHSDIKLTMGTYVDAKLLDTASAVELLPELPSTRTLAPTLAPNLEQAMVFETTRDNSAKDSDSARNENTPRNKAFQRGDGVERRRFELPTSALRTQRSPN